MTTAIEAASRMSPELRRLRWEVFTATWLSYAGFYVTRRVFSVVKAPLRAHLHIDDLAVSHLWTTYLVAYMVGQFIAAALGRRYSSRTLLLAGMAASLACNLGMGLCVRLGPQGYLPMLVLMAIHGLAQAHGWPHNVRLVANFTLRSERGTVMSFWSTCYQLGSAVAKGLAALLFGALGFLGAFCGSSLVLAAIWGFFFLYARESPAERGLSLPYEESSPSVVEREREPTPGRRFYVLVISMGLIYFGFKFLRYALDSWSALILEDHFHLTTEHAGYLSVAFDTFGFMGVLAAGPVSDRFFGSQRVPVIVWMAVGCSLATVMLSAFGLSSVPTFVLFLALIGFFAMGPDSLLSGAAAMDVGNARQASLAAGIINGLGSIGPIVQEPLIGFLLGSGGGVQSTLVLLVIVTSAAMLGTVAFLVATRSQGVKL